MNTMNKTLGQIYDDYRDEMRKTLGLEERVPHKFSKKRFVERFERKVDQLDTLIALYWDLLLARKNEPLKEDKSPFFLN